MFSLHHKTLVLVILGFVLSGCTLSQHKADSVRAIEESLVVLQSQREMLEQHSAQLQKLSVTQGKLEEQLGKIGTQLRHIELSSAKLPQNNVVDDSKKLNPKPRKSAEPDRLTNKKVVLGRYEWVWLDIISQYMKARIDTGARTSSLYATDIQEFERDGEKWVKFLVFGSESNSILEAPVVRYSKVRQASAEGSERRPVVNMTVRVGPLMEETEFSLTDRKGMLYPVLLGRNFLRDVALVDVARRLTQKRRTDLVSQAAK